MFKRFRKRARRFIDLSAHRFRLMMIPRALRARRVTRAHAAAPTPAPPRMLYVDLAVISKDDAGTGIQRVVRALAKALLRQSIDGFSLHFVAATQDRAYHRINPLGAGYAADPAPIRARVGDIFVGLDYSLDTLRWYRRQLDQFRRDGGIVWFLVHDLLPAQRPDWFSPNTVLRYRVWLDTLAAIGDGFLCNSSQTEAELVAELRKYALASSEYQTCVLPMGHDIATASVDSNRDSQSLARVRALGDAPFLLKVGTIEPRKGHIDLIRAFEKLWLSGSPLRLVLIGRLGWKVDALREIIRTHREFGNRLIWLEDIDDAGLIEAFRASEGVLVASLAEGFGLPLIEALGHGKPVLARDLPIFREHEAHGVRFFPAKASTQILADKINQWHSDIRAGAISVSAPETDWDKSAQVLLSAVTRIIPPGGGSDFLTGRQGQ